MKSQSVEWNRNTTGRRLNLAPAIADRSDRALHSITRTTLALLPAFAIVIAAAWLVARPDLAVYLQATLWASGFVFLGLTFDARPFTAVLLGATGIALPVLALLSQAYATEIAIVGAMLVAVWTAAGSFRR